MTMLLLIAILALIDEFNPQSPRSNLSPFFIGIAVAAMVAIGGPLTMTALNPARDFGPRLFGYLAGWGHVAIPGPRGNEWWLYILAPTIGGLLGGAIYAAGFGRWLANLPAPAVDRVASATARDLAPAPPAEARPAAASSRDIQTERP